MSSNNGNVSNGKSGCDLFGVRLNARGFVIDSIIIDAAVNGEAPLSVKEITRRVGASPLAAAYLVATGRPVSAVANHVKHVCDNGNVVKDGKTGGYTVNLERHGEAIKALQAAAKKPAAAAPAPKKKIVKK